MLTPIDAKLDSLTDLSPSEMYVLLITYRQPVSANLSRSFVHYSTQANMLPCRDNMKGWHDHFENKYIVCGQLVEPGEGDQ